MTVGFLPPGRYVINEGYLAWSGSRIHVNFFNAVRSVRPGTGEFRDEFKAQRRLALASSSGKDNIPERAGGCRKTIKEKLSRRMIESKLSNAEMTGQLIHMFSLHRLVIRYRRVGAEQLDPLFTLACNV